ncbi:MAG: DNA polymerase III subunit delta [Actinobacteria bacterium]|nr:MAG: DNA polymerase III subunit delta [Actinomycetota bacterium]
MAGEYKPVYYIYSNQPFLVEEALRRLRQSFAKDSQACLNCTQFEAPTHNADMVLQAAATRGFTTEKKLIIFRYVDKLAIGDQKKLVAYLKKPWPDVILVLVASKLAKSNALEAEAKKRKYFFEYLSPKKGQYGPWIKKRFATLNKKVSLEASHYLYEVVGDDLANLSNEIEKLSLYYLEKDEMSLDDIACLTSNTAKKGIFDLVDSLSEKNLSLSLNYLHSLWHIEAPLKILHMIARHFRLLNQTKVLVEQGYALRDISSKIKLPPFVAKRYMEQSYSFAPNDLKRIFSLLVDSDYQLKTSKNKPEFVMERLLAGIFISSY